MLLVGYKTNAVNLSIAIPASGSTSRLKCSIRASRRVEDYIAKIKIRLFHNREVEISPSAYDTAWMAMVPSREYSGGKLPCFPQCLDWIMENQKPNGSWGLQMENSSSLLKDSLSCTLACLLALRKWDVGDQLVHKGLEFIGSHGWAASHKAQHTPIGFEIVFPHMMNYANQLGLVLPIDTILIDNMLCSRNSEIESKRNLEYVAEGFGGSWNWKGTLLSRQRGNGSLFNSPATTAAALIHSHDDKSHEYLLSVLTTFNNCVPTTYPQDMYTRLCLVDTLESLGIDRHFRFEIESILDETYRLWQCKEEEIFEDVTCRALAFRLLRMKEYQVSSDELEEFADEQHFFNTVSIQFTGVATVLELNKASKLIINEEEVVLEKIHGWTSKFLKQKLLNETILDKRLRKEVECALEKFGSMLERVENKRNVELYDVECFQILKTAYRCPTINDGDILLLAREDFHISQAQHQKEVQQLERCQISAQHIVGQVEVWKRSRRTPYQFSGCCAVIHDPQLSDARMCFVQTVVLITRLDDFFDSHASKAEVLNFMELVRKWNKQDEAKIYDVSMESDILFTALYNTVNEWAEKARIKQGRCIKHTSIGLWLEVLTCFMKEKELSSDEERIITLDEYMSIAWVTIAVKLSVYVPAHLVGVKLSEDVLENEACGSLCKLAATVVRLLNDLHTYKREKEEGKKNSVSLLAAKCHDSEEEAVSKIQIMIEEKKIKLLQMVLSETKSGFLNVIPKEYKDLVWKTCKMAYYTYSDGDRLFRDPQQMIKDMNELIHEPLAT